MDGLTLSPSPHLRGPDSTRGIMADVLIALSPAAVMGVVYFGPRAALVLAVTLAASVFSELLWNLICRKPNSLGDCSALVTGLLLGLNLPPTIPLWMAALGGAIAIIVPKQMFGGLGQNFANPAITARIVLMVSFPAAMTNWVEPFAWRSSSLDAVTSATPLAGGEYTARELILGLHGGCIGETCSLMLLAGGLYLLIRRVINPAIPLTFVGTVALLTAVTGGDVLRAVCGGGLLIGAIFMATDYVTSPYTLTGKLIFGAGCGAITFVIRYFGNLDEGVSFSILLMNLLTPHINRLTRPKPFGGAGK